MDLNLIENEAVKRTRNPRSRTRKPHTQTHDDHLNNKDDRSVGSFASKSSRSAKFNGTKPSQLKPPNVFTCIICTERTDFYAVYKCINIVIAREVS